MCQVIKCFSVVMKVFTEVDGLGTPDAQLNPKKKVWETVQPDFSTCKDMFNKISGFACSCLERDSI